MVRFKNRYLLFEIIYADTPLGWTSIPATASSALGSSLQSHPGSNQSPFGDTGRNNCRLPPLANKDLVYAIKDSIAENFGDYGAGITQRPMTLKYFSPHTNIGILRISREEVHIVWGALTFMKELKGRPCIIKVLHTSGTIKKCQLMTIKYDRDRIMYLRNQAQLLKDTQTYTQLGLAFKDSADEVNSIEI
ncbi:ribonuclease P/MRP protein subunit POP5 [Entomortierella parvispora]|uniref:Ribonuclease P/MRP protein subunit POP5 n=1 Tax=Entomortierella parvispora TaxID=205924 RepID=A0A9P3HD32_9FUNG|nr:ribonuclease P/MRP protein subunit POP5 [Entomortierella parvispora]